MADQSHQPATAETVLDRLTAVLVPFGLVLFLAFHAGGYGEILRGGVALALWWGLALLVLLGLAPRALARPNRETLLQLGAFAALAAWMALGLIWSGSVERSLDEIVRVLLLGGAFLAGVVSHRGEGLRRAIRGVGFAIGLVGLAAIASRALPSVFEVGSSASFLPGTANRLSYPIDYWNGLAGLLAIGLPLLTVTAARSKHPLERGASAALIPICGLAIILTLSRGGTIAAIVGLLALLALSPKKGPVLSVLGIAGAGTAVLIAAALRRRAYLDEPMEAIGLRQADEIFILALVVATAVGVVVALAGRRTEQRIEALPRPSRTAVRIGLAALAVSAVVGLAAGGGDRLSQEWDSFRSAEVDPGTGAASRLSSANGSGRYQYWQAAFDAFEAEPLTGIGPGTYEFWWAENGTRPDFARDAHSLFFESLAEQGLIGLALILTLLGLPILIAARGRRGERAQLHRSADLRAAAAAGMLAFAASASLDWTWEVTVAPVAFFLIAAAVAADADGPARQLIDNARDRLVIGALAALLAAALATSFASDLAVDSSRDSVRQGNLDDALRAARDARALLPASASAALQEALVLEAGGLQDEAVLAGRDSTELEPVNWRNWLILSRLQLGAGKRAAAERSFEQARSLNPRSPTFPE